MGLCDGFLRSVDNFLWWDVGKRVGWGAGTRRWGVDRVWFRGPLREEGLNKNWLALPNRKKKGRPIVTLP